MNLTTYTAVFIYEDDRTSPPDIRQYSDKAALVRDLTAYADKYRPDLQPSLARLEPGKGNWWSVFKRKGWLKEGWGLKLHEAALDFHDPVVVIELENHSIKRATTDTDHVGLLVLNYDDVPARTGLHQQIAEVPQPASEARRAWLDWVIPTRSNSWMSRFFKVAQQYPQPNFTRPDYRHSVCKEAAQEAIKSLHEQNHSPGPAEAP